MLVPRTGGEGGGGNAVGMVVGVSVAAMTIDAEDGGSVVVRRVGKIPR